MPLELESLKKAVDAMHSVLAKSDDAEFMRGLDEIARNAIRAGVIQHFSGTAFEPMLARALATAEDHAITGDHAADHLRAGVARYWQRAQRAGQSTPEAGSPSTEEAERLRQLEMVRRSQQPKAPGALGGHS